MPVTYGNNFHLGNNPPRPGQDLIPDLMNGVVFFRGSRYDISNLDLAIVGDTGLQPLANPVPAPPALVLATVGVLGLASYGRLRGRRKSGLAAPTA